ncbi:MAG: hypothetical protein AB8B87_21960 [Granulosicoccus sp.]
MRKSRSPLLSAKRGFSLAVLSTLLASGIAYSADHADSPNQRGSLEMRQADITDLYAFMNPNAGNGLEAGNELVLMVLVGPDASGVLPAGDTTPNFSSNITYNVLMQNYNGTNAGAHSRITCTFTDATPQVVTCELGNLSVSGDVGGTASATGLRVFTGLADDPFFFNGGGLNASFAAMPPSPQFSEGANPDSQFVNANGQLNGFAGQNILAIVIGVDRDLVTDNQSSPELRLWAATAPM